MKNDSKIKILINFQKKKKNDKYEKFNHNVSHESPNPKTIAPISFLSRLRI